MSKKNIKRIIIIASILIALIILYLVLFLDENFVDVKVYSIISNFINDANTTVFKMFSFLGSTIMVMIFCIIALIFSKKYGKYIALNTIIIAFINQLMKFIIRRDRPIDINLIEETGFSFPSGHSMVNAAFYGLIIYFIYKSKMTKVKKIVSISLLFVLTLLIGISRIYLGVHYATDVLGGFIIAIIYLYVFIEVFYKKRSKTQS